MEISKYFIINFGILLLCLSFTESEDFNPENVTDNRRLQSKLEKLFRTGFLESRLQHIAAVKNILKSMNYEKQYKLTSQVLDKLFEVLKSSKSVLENSDYIPGSNFPTNQSVVGALGQVLDNTALYAEFQLKLPDITDEIMKRHYEWLVLIKWAIGFSNSTDLFDEKTTLLINLVCQEMNLIDRAENYVNPYRMKQAIASPKLLEGSPKKKKVFKKGPRMSKMSHSEL